MATFNPNSYVDQVRKYYPPDKAERMLKAYGWLKPIGTQAERDCPICGDTFTARNSRQIYCPGKALGEKCSRIAKYQKLYKTL